VSKTTFVNLDDHLTSFIQSKVETGRFDSASDVVRAGLRLLEEHESRVEHLRQALIEGEQSGDAEPFSVDQFLAESRQRLGQ
jgi:antitoxin ParD1/3/4